MKEMRVEASAIQINRKIPVIVGMPKNLIENLDAEAHRQGLDSRAELVRRLCTDGLQLKAA